MKKQGISTEQLFSFLRDLKQEESQEIMTYSERLKSMKAHFHNIKQALFNDEPLSNDRRNDLLKLRSWLNESAGTEYTFNAEYGSLEQYNELKKFYLDSIPVVDEYVGLSEKLKYPDNKKGKAKPPPELPKKFVKYLIHSDADNLMVVLHKLLDNSNCKNTAKIILALKQKGYLNFDVKAELYNAMRLEFGIRGSDSGTNRYMNLLLGITYQSEIDMTKNALP